MQSLVFEIAVGRDELGEPEVCTWDLLPVVNSSETSHLDENGLPKIGTKLRPGMIMVGKIGKAKGFHRSRKPTNLELHGLSFDELQRRFACLWINASEYVQDGITGVVESAALRIDHNGVSTVVVKINPCDE